MGVTTLHQKNMTELLYMKPQDHMNNNSLHYPIIRNDFFTSDASRKSIREFYRGTCVMITGGTGFLGKAVLEKLLRSCDTIDSIFLLMRSKRGMSVEQRFRELLKNPVFNLIKEKDPDRLNKIKIIEGDVSLPNLGLSDIDEAKVIDKVNIVFHSAATVRFNESLKDAVVLNTLGTRRIIDLCVRIQNLKSFVHVSTAFSNADREEIDEIVYNPPYDPHAIINCIENLPDDAIEVLQSKLLGNHPNTYTLTKVLAESLVWQYSAQLPACIVRPSIVTGAWKEPFPGWVDNVSGITGIMMEIGRGSIKSIMCEETFKMDAVPVDIVANTLVTSAWHTVANRSNTMRVYNCTSGNINPISWKDYGILTTKTALKFPTKYLSWYPGFSYRTNRVMHWICVLLCQTAPACIFDFILMCTKRKPMMYKISQKFKKALEAGEFSSLRQWDFKTTCLKTLMRDVKDADDSADFNVDMSKGSGFSWETYNQEYMLAIRQYILKDDSSSLPEARVKLNRFYWANKAVQMFMMYLILKCSSIL